MTVLDQWSEPVAEHGEGAVWHDGWGGLRLVDMLAGDVLAMGASGELLQRVHVDSVAAVVRPRGAGGMVVGCERTIKVFDTRNRLVSVIDLDVPADARINEGATSSDGSLWCGTMAWNQTPDRGSLYRICPTGPVVTEEIKPVSVSNGLGFISHGDRAYYVDSRTGRIDKLRLESGHVVDRSEFVTIDAEDGTPDGLCVDSDDGLWVALWGGGKVRHYNRNGTLERELVAPTPFVTACALGGPEYRDLFVTTSRLELVRSGSPCGPAGAVFHAEVEVPGVPIEEYAG